MFFILVMILILFALSIFAYSLLRKKQIIDAPPNVLAAMLFILLIFISLCFVITVPSVMLCIVALGGNFLFGEYITYDSSFSLISFSLLVGVIVVFLSPFLLFIGKGLAYLLKLPAWLTSALEWIISWIVLHLSIKYVLHIKLVNVSIWGHGTLILSFFVSFLFIGIDLIYSGMKQRKPPMDEHA
ncbi:membrane protein [Bacillus xiamenensis]|uniref:Uncharacterized protein n=1 Tax=Bacillus xiamenensis TaxID=1178537 RepID=A0ABT4F8V8_9BACI|nr:MULTISPECIES: hypothetical protein [Bacillus]MBG9910442.1 membrane protein [Bacillus xiamenensis]MCY9577016.1 hypothetical protein [Bacillus xiamenensis]QGX65092.1 hypothetical protein GPA07_06485 [Bacillus sp. ms-22]